MRSSANFRIDFSESQNANPLVAESDADSKVKWPFRVIHGHLFWCHWKATKGLHSTIVWMSANRLRLNTDKIELIWTGAKSILECLPGRGLPVTLGCDTIIVSSVARVLGVLITPDLSLEHHIDAVCAKCFFQLRQLRRVRRTLDDDSIAILVHAFVTSRVDYCISLLAGAPKTMMTSCSESWMQLHVSSQTPGNSTTVWRSFDATCYIHWLDVADHVFTFRLCVYVFLCLHGMAPSYLSELCRSVSESEGHRHLRSSGRSHDVIIYIMGNKFILNSTYLVTV